MIHLARFTVGLTVCLVAIGIGTGIALLISSFPIILVIVGLLVFAGLLYSIGANILGAMN
jgi:1,4-dihydroxy-2-naphthoate octaprenyltransferase